MQYTILFYRICIFLFSYLSIFFNPLLCHKEIDCRELIKLLNQIMIDLIS